MKLPNLQHLSFRAIVLILSLVGVLSVLIYFMYPQKIPNVVGMTANKAKDALEAAGYTEDNIICTTEGSRITDLESYEYEVTEQSKNGLLHIRNNSKIELSVKDKAIDIINNCSNESLASTLEVIDDVNYKYSIIYDGDDVTDTISTVDLASKYQVIGIEYIDSVNKQVTVSVELCSVIENNRIEKNKKTVKKEAKKAKKRREKYEKLGTNPPYEGMKEEYVDFTSWGYCDGFWEQETIEPIDDDDWSENYTWHIKDLKHKEMTFYDGKLYSFGLVDGWYFYSSIVGSDTEFEPRHKYKRGVDYAKAKLKKYVKELKKTEPYSDCSDSEVEDIAWMNAFNDWVDDLDYYETLMEVPIMN